MPVNFRAEDGKRRWVTRQGSAKCLSEILCTSPAENGQTLQNYYSEAQHPGPALQNAVKLVPHLEEMWIITGSNRHGPDPHPPHGTFPALTDLPKSELFNAHCKNTGTPATWAITVKYFQAVFKGISKIKWRKEILLLKGMLNTRLIIQPLYFNEVCFTSSGICFVTPCESQSTSVQDKGFCLSRLGLGVLQEDAGQCSHHSCPVSPWASKASAFIPQKLWVL